MKWQYSDWSILWHFSLTFQKSIQVIEREDTRPTNWSMLCYICNEFLCHFFIVLDFYGFNFFSSFCTTFHSFYLAVEMRYDDLCMIKMVRLIYLMVKFTVFFYSFEKFMELRILRFSSKFFRSCATKFYVSDFWWR